LSDSRSASRAAATAGALHLFLLHQDALLDERFLDLLEGDQDGLAVVATWPSYLARAPSTCALSAPPSIRVAASCGPTDHTALLSCNSGSRPLPPA